MNKTFQRLLGVTSHRSPSWASASHYPIVLMKPCSRAISHSFTLSPHECLNGVVALTVDGFFFPILTVYGIAFDDYQ